MMLDSTKGPVELPEGGVLDPSTGELIPYNDVDGLIDAYERMDKYYQQSKQVRMEIAYALLKLTKEVEKNTRYVQGERRKVQVKLPDIRWAPPTLKMAWEKFPQFRDQLLKISEIGVKLIEYKKACETAGTKEFEAFMAVVKSADLGRVGVPTITILDTQKE